MAEPFTQILIGPAKTILEDIVYALPPRACVVETTAACETSVDGTNWVSFTSGDVTSAAFIRCTGSDAIVIAKALEEAPSGGGGSGDVVGPASAVVNDIVTFSNTDGKHITDGGKAAIVDDNIETGNKMLLMNDGDGASHDFALRSIANGVGVGRPDGVLGRPFGARHLLLAGAGINAAAFPVSIWSDQRQGFQAASGRQFGWTASATESADTLDTAFSRSAAAVVEVNNGTPGTLGELRAAVITHGAISFDDVPATPIEGMVVAINDSDTVVWGAAVTGSGALHALIYYNGTNWTVIGK